MITKTIKVDSSGNLVEFKECLFALNKQTGQRFTTHVGSELCTTLCQCFCDENQKKYFKEISCSRF